MKEITLEELLEAGCHFGHQVTRSNPKARDFVFESRDNIQIIDLAKTKEGLDQAANFAKNLGQLGGKILIVATKKQAKEIVVEEVKRVKEGLSGEGLDSIFYITQRWIGGILTNFTEVSKNFKKLEDLKKLLSNDDEKSKYTKKELGLFDKEKTRLESFYAGIINMKKKPDAMFIIDSHLEDIAVKEALSTNVKTVAIVDTNADPFIINYPIPANDDAVGSIKLIVSHILDSFAEGLKNPKIKKEPIEKKDEKKKKSDDKEVKKSTEEKVAKKAEKEKPKPKKK